ncbi:hypothetical protein KC573_00290 [candidate division WWE3 bacterium]|uniref:Adenine methyltransferase n=1 Tax=candidate division WWE3 bacterium TaxID=2053526 RepID=A0A955LVA8_UNCKA|nr:hypothetical protein [candidate division WWE3 bacterium]
MKYDIIAADPPWTFTTWGKDRSEKAPQYDLMTLDDIKSLPVCKISHENTILLLWATNPLLPKAFEVAEAWGFPCYATVVFAWVKTTRLGNLQAGTGYYTQSNMEPVLLFHKGSPYPRAKAGIHQIIHSSNLQTSMPGFEEYLPDYIQYEEVLFAQAGAHSKKPPTFYNRVEQLWGAQATRLELFAREKRKGWAVIGNEINGLDAVVAINIHASMKRKEEVCFGSENVSASSLKLDELAREGGAGSSIMSTATQLSFIDLFQATNSSNTISTKSVSNRVLKVRPRIFMRHWRSRCSRSTAPTRRSISTSFILTHTGLLRRIYIKR